MPENTELSKREIEILELVATGASNKEIAQELFISKNTVKVHLRNIFSKIGAASRTEAAMYAVREGYVSAGIEIDKEGQTDTTTASKQWYKNTWAVAIVALVFVVLSSVIGFNYIQEQRMLAAEIASLPTPSARWTELPDMPTARHSMAVAEYENKIYAIGGETDQGITGVVERFNTETNKWIELTSKLFPVADAKGAVIGGLVYVPGGRLSTGDVINKLEIYDPAEDTWDTGPDLPVALSAYAMAAFEGRLYLFGGWDGQKYLDLVYVYDPNQDVWKEQSPMLAARGFAGAAVAGDKIFVIGGKNEGGILNITEEYIPAKEESAESPWRLRRIFEGEGRSGMSVVNIVDQIYLFGGEGEGVNETLRYSPEKDEWQSDQLTIQSDLSNMAVIIIGKYLHTFGGKIGGESLDHHSSTQIIYTIAIPVVR